MEGAGFQPALPASRACECCPAPGHAAEFTVTCRVCAVPSAIFTSLRRSCPRTGQSLAEELGKRFLKEQTDGQTGATQASLETTQASVPFIPLQTPNKAPGVAPGTLVSSSAGFEEGPPWWPWDPMGAREEAFPAWAVVAWYRATGHPGRTPLLSIEHLCSGSQPPTTTCHPCTLRRGPPVRGPPAQEPGTNAKWFPC